MGMLASLVLAVVVTACSNDEANKTSTTAFARTVSFEGFTFTLPTELQFRTDGFISTGEAIDGFYGNVPLGSACKDGCGLRSFSPLPAGSVVVGFGVIGANPVKDPPPNTTIAGHAAVLSTEKPGTCGGDETINARIPNPSGAEIIVRACLSGPDLTDGERTVQAVLASAAFGGA
jgi:hypothetical protein